MNIVFGTLNSRRHHNTFALAWNHTSANVV